MLAQDSVLMSEIEKASCWALMFAASSENGLGALRVLSPAAVMAGCSEA